MKGLLTLLALCLTVPVSAAVTLSQANPGQKDGGVISVGGTWASSCTPEFEQLRRDAEFGGLVLIAVQRTEACHKAETTFEFEVNLALEAADLGAGVYPVSLYVRPDTTRAARLVGFDVVQVGELDRVTPEAGLWWPEPAGRHETSGPGVGFSLEIQGDQAIIMSNAYRDTGQSLWTLTTGSLDGRVVRGELTELGQGQVLFNEYREPNTAFRHGRVILSFANRARATLWLVTEQNPDSPELLVQPLSLVRFAFGQRDLLSGTWLLIPEAGGEAQRLELAAVEGAADRITLLDPSGATVQCQALGSVAPPSSCRLQGLTDIRFDDVGLYRWRGQDAQGRAYVAVRLEDDE
ncbi:MAG: hypothetical protein AAGA23_21845 [Pseudomonadota bacterium]